MAAARIEYPSEQQRDNGLLLPHGDGGDVRLGQQVAIKESVLPFKRFLCGKLALRESVREVAVEAHDLAGRAHLGPEQDVDGLATPRARCRRAR